MLHVEKEAAGSNVLINYEKGFKIREVSLLEMDG
jgi:hypothetical protein